MFKGGTCLKKCFFETYRFSGITAAGGGDGIGRPMYNFETRPVKETITIPQGSWWVPMKQRRARLILAALEPQSPDSFVRYGYMYSAIESPGGGGAGRGGGRGGRGGAAVPESVMPGEYLSEPIARKTMADNPELAREFLAKVSADPAFAADRSARLLWWYQHSRYAPSDNGRYPIVRVWEKNW